MKEQQQKLRLLKAEDIALMLGLKVQTVYTMARRGELEKVKLSIVQFFFNETKSKDEVSRFWLWDSHRENPVGDVEKRLPYLPQDRRSRSDPYLGIPPR